MSSILPGSTIGDISLGTENNSEFRLLPCACGRHAISFALPPNIGTNHETLARVTRFWHATRTRTVPAGTATIATVRR